MKTIILTFGLLLSLSPIGVQADAQPSAFEKALYDKARYDVLHSVGDDDFISYCTTMNLGGDTLVKIHDQLLAQETELTRLLKEGMAADNPQMQNIDATIRDLKAQLAAKVVEARKGLELESKIAEATLSSLAQYQK